MKRYRLAAVLALSATLMGGALMAQTKQEHTGPAVGDTIPQFSLPDQQGRMRDFQSLCGPKGLIILFFRSASW